MEIKTESGNYIFKTDSYNCWIEKKTRGGKRQVVGGYHKNFNECLKALFELRLKESEADSLKYIITELISIQKEFDMMIDKFIPF